MKEKNYDASFGAASGSALEVDVTVLYRHYDVGSCVHH